MRLDVLTLFPEILAGYLGQSVLKLAINHGLVEVNTYNIRDWATGRHRKVDDRPFGGGAGMVLMPDPVIQCVEAVQAIGEKPGRLIMLTPQGRQFSQPVAEQYAEQQRLVLLCGRYEGFDERIIEILQPDELSIGDYILGGGETAAMVVIDAVARLVPGVLGDEESHRDDSFSGEGRRLEYPQYTRPREYRGQNVPEVLLGGNHQQIETWRRQQSVSRTRQRRADLLNPDSNETRSEE
jgi:tRNA (guanine37-N1)-methyltransferase